MSRLRRLAVLSLIVSLAATSGAEAKGEGPTHVAVAFGSVWVGLGSGEVRAYDEVTGELRERHLRGRAPTESVHGLVAAERSIWVAGGSEVARIDPRSRRVRDVPRSGYAFTLVAGAGSVWALTESRITRIDASAGHSLAAIAA